MFTKFMLHAVDKIKKFNENEEKKIEMVIISK